MSRFMFGSSSLSALQLLTRVQCGASRLLLPGASLASSSGLDATARSADFASLADAEANTAVQQAARELGLDAVRLPELREMMAAAILEERDEGGVALAPAKQKKLTISDLQGYEAVLKEVYSLPDTHDMPSAPALDAGQWVDTHFKEVGLGFEPRSAFYAWRAWAARSLPTDQYRTLIALDQIMVDDAKRSAFLKQAQHELARLWDWQHRRAALGLSLDPLPDSSNIPQSAAAAAANAAANAAASAAASAIKPAAAAETAASAASLPEPEAAVEAVAASAAADTQGSSSNSSSSSSSSGDYDVSAPDVPDLSDKGMLEILEVSGALSDAPISGQTAGQGGAQQDGNEASGQGQAALATAAAAASSSSSSSDAEMFDTLLAVSDSWPSWAQTFSADDVIDECSARAAWEQKEQAAKFTKLAQNLNLRDQMTHAVQQKVKRGQESVRFGKYRTIEDGVVQRVYTPVSHDDDRFLPTPPVGSKWVSAKLSNPKRCRKVSPAKVAQQAVALAEASRRGAAAGGSSSRNIDSGDWSSLPLLDRTILHTESLRQAAQRLAAKPKRQQPWELLPLDSYTFDLQQRPPTRALDLLTSYLEVKYADVLLRKDAVKTMQKQLAIDTLTRSGSGSTKDDLMSEILESPPAALTASRTLSAVERDGIVRVLDGLLQEKQFQQYREAVLQLYCDGLVTWAELQQCWAAAEAGEELQAAATAPITWADNRQGLFAVISGQKQLEDVTAAVGSSSSGSNAGGDAAAARKLWEEAGQKLHGSWAAAASAAAAKTTSRSSKIEKDWWQQQVRFEEAERIWQQLLQLTGRQGPKFVDVLLSDSSGTNNGGDALQQQLQQLQQELQAATGLSVASSSRASADQQQQSAEEASTLAIGDFSKLQQLLASPPSLDELLKQHWEVVSQKELKQAIDWEGPAWPQLWQLLQKLTTNHQHLQHSDDPAEGQAGSTAAATINAGAAAGLDTVQLFERYLAEAEAVPLTPPPYPGARKLLRWEQQIMLHAGSGTTVLPAEVKAKMRVSAAELQEETGLSTAGLQHILAIAGNRYDAKTGLLSLSCDRFPTREENRRWCLEILHRLLQEAQEQYPSQDFLLKRDRMDMLAGPAAVAAISAL